VEGDAEHWAHVGVGGFAGVVEEEDDEASGDVASVLVLGGGEGSSTMAAGLYWSGYCMRS
jgi:hypothetical protein